MKKIVAIAVLLFSVFSAFAIAANAQEVSTETAKVAISTETAREDLSQTEWGQLVKKAPLEKITNGGTPVPAKEKRKIFSVSVGGGYSGAIKRSIWDLNSKYNFSGANNYAIKLGISPLPQIEVFGEYSRYGDFKGKIAETYIYPDLEIRNNNGILVSLSIKMIGVKIKPLKTGTLSPYVFGAIGQVNVNEDVETNMSYRDETTAGEFKSIVEHFQYSKKSTAYKAGLGAEIRLKRWLSLYIDGYYFEIPRIKYKEDYVGIWSSPPFEIHFLASSIGLVVNF